MQIPAWTPTDLLAAWQRMLPRGRAWRTDRAAVITQASGALMPSWWRVIQSAVNLLVDAFPATAVRLLPDWQSALGLPDQCTPLGATLAQQQQAVVEKLTRGGGQSVPYYIAVAAQLGYTITIVEGAPASRIWTVHAASTAPSTVFRAGASRAGDLLQTLGSNTQLECVLEQIAPADTVLHFAFS
jgi:uncharacterized protein YmfQ (DUF2313 family)